MFCLISSSLRPLDVEFMKALHEKVNIVPVLAKADTLTPGEVKKKKIKARRLHVSSHESICVYAAECFICILTEDVIHTLTSDMFFHCFSLQIREEIEQYGIKIYQFPDCDSDEDEDFKQQDHELKVISDLLSFFSSSKYLCLVH